MSDLISREYVLTEYNRQHQGPPGGARKIMAEAPTIDAIPVEWLEDKMHNSPKELSLAAWRVLNAWRPRNEQEGKNEHERMGEA